MVICTPYKQAQQETTSNFGKCLLSQARCFIRVSFDGRAGRMKY